MTDRSSNKTKATRVDALLARTVIRTIALACSAVLAYSLPSPTERIRGQIISDASFAAGGLVIEIRSPMAAGDVVRTAVLSDGSFEVETGDWPQSDWIEVSVLGQGGTVLHRQRSAIMSSVLEVRMESRSAGQPPGGVVTLEQLRNPPGKRFRKAMHRAERALSRNDLDEAVEQLATAARLEPAQQDAHVQLGVVLLQMKDHQSALSAFQAATALAPELEAAQSGLAMSLHGVGRLPEAAKQARAALASHPDSARCHYVLGLILAQTGQHDDVVLDLLHKAASEYPQALLVEAHVRAARGEKREAEDALRRCVSRLEPGSAHRAACSAKLESFVEP